mmetsp:Transcript_124076/g.351287  ORF Transcript_124076/g.351287 Transcript_124076/m.351287 type:complete len:206 (-) Transcript_124076:977-1594(-)
MRTSLLSPPKVPIRSASSISACTRLEWVAELGTRTPRALHSSLRAGTGISCHMHTWRSRRTMSLFSTHPSVDRPRDLQSARSCLMPMPCHRSHSPRTALAPVGPSISMGMPCSSHLPCRELMDSSSGGSSLAPSSSVAGGGAVVEVPCASQGRSVPNAASSLQTASPAGVAAEQASSLSGERHSSNITGEFSATSKTRMVSSAGQ